MSAELKATGENSSPLSFSQFDYAIVFLFIIVFNTVSGIYFAFFARKQSSTNEYLMGGRTMKTLPIAISLIASYTSANTFIAVPADVYQYGAAYLLGGLSNVILTFLTVFFYLPVFFKLKVTSVYEYLEKRFDYRTRLLASFLSTLSYILYLPIVIYVPSLMFSTATGISVQFISTVMCGLCIFYTSVGGLKAVVWTDTVQFITTTCTISTIYILGLKSAGGFQEMWTKATDGGRLDIFDFDLDPTKRDGFWSVLIGLTVLRMASITVAQETVQKFLAVPTYQSSALTVIYFGIGLTIVKTVTVFLGLLMYAKYADCDPLSVNKVATADQLVMYFVMDLSENIPGLAGLFVAGVFSASLSALSASLNCVAGIIYSDFVSKLSSRKIGEREATNILKIIVVVAGITCTLLVYVVKHLGGLFSVGMSLGGITGGSILGMFSMGLFFPSANAKGAFFGAICGLVVTTSIVFPSQYYESQGYSSHFPKPLSTKGCLYSNVTYTEHVTIAKSSVEVPFLFRISFYYYTLIGAAVTMIIGLTVSYVTNTNKDIVDANLINPVRFWQSFRKTRQYQRLPTKEIST